MGRCGLITTGILAFIAGICSVVVGILVLVTGVDSLCQQTEWSVIHEESGSGNYNTETVTAEDCTIGANVFAGVAIGGGSLWLLISLFIFVFTCGSRYDAFLLARDAADKDVVIMVDQQNNTKVEPEEEQPRVVVGVVTGNDV
jgi:hypothetical protein